MARIKSLKIEKGGNHPSDIAIKIVMTFTSLELRLKTEFRLHLWGTDRDSYPHEIGMVYPNYPNAYLELTEDDVLFFSNHTIIPSSTGVVEGTYSGDLQEGNVATWRTRRALKDDTDNLLEVKVWAALIPETSLAIAYSNTVGVYTSEIEVAT